MIELNKCIYVYIVLIELWTRSPNKEVENFKIRSVFKCFRRFVNLGKSEKQRKLWPIFLKKIQVFEKERKKKIITSLPHYFLKIC